MIGRLLLCITAGLLLTATAMAQPAPVDARCVVPEALLFNEQPMPRVAQRVKSGEPLRVVVLGSSSSLQTGKGLPRSYAAGLPEALNRHFAGLPLQVENLSERTLSAPQMAALIAQRIPALKPDLVIWQTGNVDAAQKIEIDSFAEALNSGLQNLQAVGIDTLLVSPQYRQRLSVMVDVEPYNLAMAQIAAAEDVVLFRRFEMMRHWGENETFDFRGDQAQQMREAEAQNRCLAEHIATVIADAVRLAAP